MNVRTKALALVGAVSLVLAGLTTSAQAAPTRYEAETAPATCDGTIDSNHTGFSGTGFCNAMNAIGGNATWTVNATSAGSATIAIRYANGTTTNRPADISVNGTVVQAASAFNPTGAWTTWATKTLTANVNAGNNVIRVAGTTAVGPANLDFIDFEVAPPANFTDYQAESCTISQGLVESNHAGFTGTGFVNTDNVAGSYVQCSVSSAAAGSFSVEIRYANGTTTDRPMSITVNGTVVEASRSFAGTGAWATWATQTLNVNLNAGANTIRVTATTAGGGPNLDRFRVGAPADTERPTAPGQPVCSNIGETTIDLAWPLATDNVGVVAYDIFHLGTQIATAPTSPTTLTGLTPNTEYSISVFARDAAGNVGDTSPLAICRTAAVNDPTPPTAPGNLAFSGVTQTSVNLTWTASTDNRGVTAYNIRNSSNATIHTVTGTPPATSTTVPGLTCGTAYTLHAVARDAAMNTSPSSNTVSFTTSACGGRGTPQTPTTIAGGWDIPWDISWYPDGSAALVTERDTFRVFKLSPNGTKTQVGSVPNSQTTDGEGGLMGVALSPTWNGTSDQDVFFFHTSTDANRIAKMTFNGSTLTGYTTLLTGIRKSRFHNGGRLKFGPDGFLYATTGDSQQSNLAQNRDSLNGKILRLTKTGAAAPGNPFGTRIYSWGHRNPQGIAWDSAGRLWSSELGN
ncbi:MAG TPA: oxidoreductase, partial [Micromonosporaceae bacterium]|nr:oxidoreductase [Micromonosporaceae bacterium]